MVMSWIWAGILLLSLIFSLTGGKGSELSAAVAQGAQSGITLAISMAGSLCLWTGVGNLMEKTGITGLLARFLSPVLNHLFPETKSDPVLARSLSGNVCANILGLGNAATPMGIQSARRMLRKDRPGVATDSIQLIPANVAAVRASLGCGTPFDILPAVWVTSLCSAGLGLTAAWLLGKLWKHD